MKKDIKQEDAFVEDELLLGLQNSIFEVEKLLIKTIRERNILANQYSDAYEDVKKLSSYAEGLIKTLQRTNLYYFDQLALRGEKTVYNAVVSRLDEHAKKANKHMKTVVSFDLGWELESYFEEKGKIARAYKNLFSQSDLTVTKKNKELDALWEMYGFSYFEDCALPDCPILPTSKKEDGFNWQNGFILLVPGADPLKKPYSLQDVPKEEYKYYTIFGAKPVVTEKVEVDLDSFSLEK